MHKPTDRHFVVVFTAAAILMNCSFPIIDLLADEEPKTANVVQTLLEQYEHIRTVQCDVRREMVTPKGSIRWLSQVYFDNAGKLHAANAAPISRRIISDGTTMFQHTEGHPRGFKRAITNLNETMTHNLQRVPGTLMEHLQRLAHIEEMHLEATENAPIRRRYQTDKIQAVLEADAQYRIHTIRFYNTQKPEVPTAEVTCSQYQEVTENIWIPMLHQTIVQAGKNQIRERIRFTNYVANKPLPEDIFNAKKHFKDNIEWVNAFDQL